jgi:hypothetical protein
MHDLSVCLTEIEALAGTAQLETEHPGTETTSHD